jgi:hypothetical protein
VGRMIPVEGAYKVQVQTSSGQQAEYRPGRDGSIEVADPRQAVWLRREGLASPAGAAGPTAHLRGYRCPCGRRNFFKTCGGCGAEDGVPCR